MTAEPLPFVDVHSVTVAASRETVWSALVDHVRSSLLLPDRHLLGRVLGTEPPAGFEETESVPPRRLVLDGHHRFATYRLTFELTGGPDAGGSASATQLRAVTHAVFPGLRGTAYRLLVIRSGGHSVATARILRAVRRRALAAH